jgi:hypothetical protein
MRVEISRSRQEVLSRTSNDHSRRSIRENFLARVWTWAPCLFPPNQLTSQVLYTTDPPCRFDLGANTAATSSGMTVDELEIWLRKLT